MVHCMWPVWGAWTNSWLVVSSHLLSSRGRVCLMKIKSCQNSTCVRHCLGSTGITMRDPPPPLNTGGEAPVRSKPGESWGNWVNRVVQGCCPQKPTFGTWYLCPHRTTGMHSVHQLPPQTPTKIVNFLLPTLISTLRCIYAMLYVIVKKTVFVEVVANKSLSVYK